MCARGEQRIKNDLDRSIQDNPAGRCDGFQSTRPPCFVALAPALHILEFAADPKVNPGPGQQLVPVIGDVLSGSYY